MQRGRRREASLHVESVPNPPRAGTSASPHVSLTLPVLCASVSWTRTKRVRHPDGRYVHSGWKMFPSVAFGVAPSGECSELAF